MKYIQTRVQRHWDWRAAANFVLGGAGCGLLVVSCASSFPAAPPAGATLVALAMVATGLALVGLGLGRPLRGWRVFLHSETSWMSREAAAAILLFVLALTGIATGVAGLVHASAFAALAFLYCQARMLRAARGIVAWRERALGPYIMTTGLVEGTGIALMLGAWAQADWLAYLAVALLVLRALAWVVYRGRLHATGAPLAVREELAKRNAAYLVAGHVLPLALLVIGLAAPPAAPVAFFAAGALAVWAGWQCKYQILGRASYGQGFAIGATRRGVPRDRPTERKGLV